MIEMASRGFDSRTARGRRALLDACRRGKPRLYYPSILRTASALVDQWMTEQAPGNGLLTALADAALTVASREHQETCPATAVEAELLLDQVAVRCYEAEETVARVEDGVALGARTDPVAPLLIAVAPGAGFVFRVHGVPDPPEVPIIGRCDQEGVEELLELASGVNRRRYGAR